MNEMRKMKVAKERELENARAIHEKTKEILNTY
jgi:hypothetical protein